MLENHSINDKLRKAEENLTGRKFCVSCQNSKPIEGGMIVGTKVKRWACANCLKFSKQKKAREK
jgi:hypothetical protein